MSPEREMSPRQRHHFDQETREKFRARIRDLIKKVLHHGTPLDREKLIKEMGDVRWYLEYLAAALGVSMSEVEAANVAKLRARYPDGFSHEAANAPRHA